MTSLPSAGGQLVKLGLYNTQQSDSQPHTIVLLCLTLTGKMYRLWHYGKTQWKCSEPWVITFKYKPSVCYISLFFSFEKNANNNKWKWWRWNLLYLLANFDKHANRTCIATIRACHSVYKRETDTTEFTDLWMLPACYWTHERHGHSAPHWLQLDSLCSAAHRPTRTHADTGSRLYLTSARSRGRDLSMLYLADTQRHNYTRFTHGELSINHTTVTETYNW